MTPFTNTMSFVDGQQSNRARREDLKKLHLTKSFGRYIQQSVLARSYLFITRLTFLFVQRGINKGRSDSFSLQRVNLIFWEVSKYGGRA